MLINIPQFEQVFSEAALAAHCYETASAASLNTCSNFRFFIKAKMLLELDGGRLAPVGSISLKIDPTGARCPHRKTPPPLPVYNPALLRTNNKEEFYQV